jgi:hypothetical protein
VTNDDRKLNPVIHITKTEDWGLAKIGHYGDISNFILNDDLKLQAFMFKYGTKEQQGKNYNYISAKKDIDSSNFNNRYRFDLSGNDTYMPFLIYEDDLQKDSEQKIILSTTDDLITIGNNRYT